MAKGTIKITATIPPIQAAFKFLDGGGARVTLDLDPESAGKYFAFIQLANRQQLIVKGELGAETVATVTGKVQVVAEIVQPKLANTGPR